MLFSFCITIYKYKYSCLKFGCNSIDLLSFHELWYFLYELKVKQFKDTYTSVVCLMKERYYFTQVDWV